ncbi:MarR family winged helix-turn-helix transcriptional regulator [Oceanibacterium hippocampi]|uniref:Transcriptional regulator SlyA n=1 Tax=Oceanibacterium hippocampi TaxID=745714 RepID=A0A1Y5RWU2_9PROT|nr:MarR family transcriptional regulator [Oceanibacterium hippocampi]SLN24353.1 Transcriptional regulator SlyA [Oceanibacterium hippocampi]
MTAREQPPVGFMLSDVSRLLRRNFLRRAQEHGLTQAQWKALFHLARQEGVNQATLAESMEVQPITLARLIDKLAEAELVERRPDPADRRAFRLFLTAKAKPLLDQMWTLARESREEAMEGLSEAERKALVSGLEHMKERLLDAEGRGAGCPPSRYNRSA